MAEKILIADDDVETLRLVGLMLQRQGYDIIAASNGSQAVAQAHSESPNLIILDVMMPDMDGYQVCRQLRLDPVTSSTPILMFTAKSQVEDKVAGYDAGVDEYITKPIHPAELVARVKAIMKRSQRKDVSSGSLSLDNGLLTIDSRSLEVRKNGSPVSLTPTEFRILSVLAASPGRVFTRGELVESALGYQFEGYERSIDAHIKNVRQKIEDDPRTPAFIHTVYGVGYKFAGKIDDQKPLG